MENCAKKGKQKNPAKQTVSVSVAHVKMIFNFFASIFGKSSDTIATTIVVNKLDMDVNDAVDDGVGEGVDANDDITINSNNYHLMDAPATESTMTNRRHDFHTPDASSEYNYRRLPQHDSGGRDGVDGEATTPSIPAAHARPHGRDLNIRFPQQTTNRKTNQTAVVLNQTRQHLNRGGASNSSHEISIYTVYILFASFFICICTIAVLLMAYMGRMNDIAHLRADLNGKFVGRDDIDAIVRSVSIELQVGGDDGDGDEGIRSTHRLR